MGEVKELKSYVMISLGGSNFTVLKVVKHQENLFNLTSVIQYVLHIPSQIMKHRTYKFTFQSPRPSPVSAAMSLPFQLSVQGAIFLLCCTFTFVIVIL